MRTVTERVARGAALLDAKMPGWAARIDVEWLQLSSCTRCVLGHLFGEFSQACDLLGIRGSEYGFDNGPRDELFYELAPALWRKEIAARLSIDDVQCAVNGILARAAQRKEEVTV